MAILIRSVSQTLAILALGLLFAAPLTAQQVAPDNATDAADDAATDTATDAAVEDIVGSGLDTAEWTAPEQPLASVMIVVGDSPVAESSRVSTWLGRSVHSEQGTEIGTLSEMVLRSPRRIESAVIAIGGGPLGLGATDVLVPAAYLRLKEDENGTMLLTLAIGDQELETTLEARAD